MDFFAQQDKARHKTKWLVFYFVIAVILIIAMIYFVVLLGFFYAGARHYRVEDSAPALVLWNPKAFFGATLGTLAVIFLASAYKTNELSGGGGSVATLMGGRPVDPNTTDPDERKLLNV